MIWTLNIIIKIVLIMLSVAFITLFERKILGLSQNRVGPNKVFFKGILQPVIDGFKLFLKECFLPMSGVFLIFFLGPMVSFLIMILIWSTLKETFNFFSSKILIMLFMICLGLSVYSTLLSGWSSVSKFASLGMVRSCSQSISYEVSMALFFIMMIMTMESFKLSLSKYMYLYILFLPIFLPWFFSCLAETNRAPFDFSEGESELISGFNIEFGAITFTFLFLAEYGMIIFFSLFSSMLFFNFYFVFSLFIIFLFLLIRSVYPRFRYDKLMKLTWLFFLPVSIFFLQIMLFI